MSRKAFNKLKPKTQAFVLEYMKGFNAARAAREAFGTASKSAKARGWEMTHRDDVKAAIRELLDEAGLTTGRVKVELAAIAFGGDLADFEPYLDGEKSLNDLRDEGIDTRMVSEAHRESGKSGDRRRIKLHDRLTALKELARVLGMVTPDKSDTVPVLHLTLNVKEKA